MGVQLEITSITWQLEFTWHNIIYAIRDCMCDPIARGRTSCRPRDPRCTLTWKKHGWNGLHKREKMEEELVELVVGRGVATRGNVYDKKSVGSDLHVMKSEGCNLGRRKKPRRKVARKKTSLGKRC